MSSRGCSGIEKSFRSPIEFGSEVRMGNVDKLSGAFPNRLAEKSSDAIFSDYGIGKGTRDCYDAPFLHLRHDARHRPFKCR